MMRFFQESFDGKDAILYSLIATCKANEVDSWQYFVTMLHQIRLCKSEADYQKLLPQNIIIPEKDAG